MSEKLRSSHEHPVHSPELEHRQQEALKETLEKAKSARHEHAENIEQIRAKAEAAASEKTPELPRSEHQEREHRPTFVNYELKNMAYQRTMKRIRRQLPAPSRALSRIVHQPAVEAASEFAGKTVARPSGILAGGIFAFLGSSIFLWVSRHYGYEYNFLLFALLFIAGFFVGLLVEIVLRMLRKKEN